MHVVGSNMRKYRWSNETWKTSPYLKPITDFLQENPEAMKQAKIYKVAERRGPEGTTLTYSAGNYNHLPYYQFVNAAPTEDGNMPKACQEWAEHVSDYFNHLMKSTLKSKFNRATSFAFGKDNTVDLPEGDKASLDQYFLDMEVPSVLRIIYSKTDNSTADLMCHEEIMGLCYEGEEAIKKFGRFDRFE